MLCGFVPLLIFGCIVVATLRWPFFLSIDMCVRNKTWLDCVICLEDVSGMGLVLASVLACFSLKYSIIGCCAQRCVEAYF